MRLPIFQGFAGSLSKIALNVALLGAVALTSCAEHKIVDENYQTQKDQAQTALQQIAPKQPLSQALTIDKSPYYGSVATPITNGSPLPPEFEHNGALVMTFARPVTMPELARMIQAVTGLRATASTSTSSDGTQSAATFMPSDGEEVAGGRVVWQGRLSSLLDQAADSFGADWRYDGTTIQFAQAVTRTFMLHALASELSVTGSVSSGSGGESGSNLPQVDVSSTSNMKVWEEIKEAVATIMGDTGKAAFSPSTGTITVTGSPDTVRRVENYLNQQNAMRLRRVAVAIKIISVNVSNDFNLEADLTGIIKRAFNHATLRTVGDAASGLAIGVLKSPQAVELPTDPTVDPTLDQISSDRLITELRANKGIEKAATTHSGALVTLSDQPAPLQVGRQISYLARTSATTGDTGGSVSLEPGTVNAGLMMTILPRIVEQNRILMRVSVAITDVPQILEYGTDDNKIQLPQVDTTGFLQNAVMTSGETLVLAGFEKELNNKSESGVPGLRILGGKKNTSRGRELTVMLLTSEILPEEPMAVIGNE